MTELINRNPVVSGRFYPDDAHKLINDLEIYFNDAEVCNQSKRVHAIISPHAGYMYSGSVAASAFKQIDRNATYDNVFILAPSHRASFKGASIYNIGHYTTPLGTIEVNFEIANQLIKEQKYFCFNNDTHLQEHSIEVQLPFLQYWLHNSCKIIPIVIGTQDLAIIKKLSKALLPYFNDKNLFVISSDFSHYPNYNDALIADKSISEAVISKSVKTLEKAVIHNQGLGIKNLATSACGISAIYTLLFLLEPKNNIKIELIKQSNSGDSGFGNHNRVVGYLSFMATSNIETTELSLSQHDKKTLLQIARKAIKDELNLNDSGHEKMELQSSYLELKCGVFVSIHNNGALRGCIGRFESDKPLYQLVELIAIASAFHDSRFNPISIDEIEDIQLEISVLSPLKPINSKHEIVLGKHGIYIKQGLSRGTLLPQVATNNNWTVDEFLGYCSKHKAGLGIDGWKLAELYTYTADVFSE